MQSYNFVSNTKYINKIKPKNNGYDSIALFSGGLDSFAGSYYLSKKNKPFFMSIAHGNIGKLLDKVYSSSPVKDNKIIIKIDREMRGEKYTESTQFSRSLVYLSFATVMALSKGVNKIYIPENGVIAHQIGLNQDRFGTRTVHPIFLNRFRELVSRLFDIDFEIVNPFAYLTKGEVVKYIPDHNTIKHTVSCAHYTKFNDTKYCGMCMPCVMRIVSLVSQGIVLDREISKAGVNPFLINLDDPDINESVPKPNRFTNMFFRDAILNILDVIKFANEIQKYSKEDLLSKYYELNDDNLYNMYVRFSIEVIKSLKYYANTNSSLKDRIPEINKK